MSLAFPKFKGFRESIYNMSLAKKYHRTYIVRSYCDLSVYEELDRLDTALHGAKIFSNMGINYSIIRSYYTSGYWQFGALVSFFNYIPGHASYAGLPVQYYYAFSWIVGFFV